ncbi:MAG: NADH-quinone oxidoreductase subunit NuoF [Acidobacteriota bacterium]|jgi:NADH:ubiquinone oxidoreductase subunit F (NADH-binding)|nr:NADH-quinone oxidoreductase subunit NuoF [Acidobacteriota bacterium]
MLQETRIVLRNVGEINPVSVEDYRKRGGYESLRKALTMPPEDVIAEIEKSRLRGRGGAGFPTARKWSFVLKAESEQKYVICNADEGEPGTNKDRIVLSNDPNSVFEGMAIAAWAVGADRGFLYLRFEYPYVFPILEQALQNARDAGCLGKNIFGTDFNFDITVVSGGGAYVCGEETALIESIEGNRGEPRFKPPYPGISGLYGKPTVVNNVETLANIPVIMDKGGEWFSKTGVPSCTGTKVFTLCGNIAQKGVFEYPMGTNLRDIFETHGGVKDNRDLRGFMLGGQSGNLINASQIDLPMDIDSCQQAESVLGTGTIMVIDDYTEILDIVENIMKFFIEESCGKCTPCREGNIRIYEVIQRINRGEGKMDDMILLEELAETMNIASLCGLGQNSSVAVITSMHNFREDYLKAIERGRRA